MVILWFNCNFGVVVGGGEYSLYLLYHVDRKLIKVSYDLEPAFSSWYTLTNGDFFYKYKFPLQNGNFHSV